MLIQVTVQVTNLIHTVQLYEAAAVLIYVVKARDHKTSIALQQIKSRKFKLVGRVVDYMKME